MDHLLLIFICLSFYLYVSISTRFSEIYLRDKDNLALALIAGFFWPFYGLFLVFSKIVSIGNDE